MVRVAGFHRWPDADESVAFLGDRHRHLFTIRVEWRVQHNDRDVEFFGGQRRVRATLAAMFNSADHGIEFGGRSCEHIAEQLGVALGAVAVEVWEDDENGSRVELATP